MTDIEQRKVDHIALCSREEVEFRLKRTLLEEVHLIHNSLPEIDEAEIDTSLLLLGKKLKAPVIISGMTGGAPRAQIINQTLASVAEELGIGFGVGSQRAMLVRPDTAETYAVREQAPNALILGNIGVIQARDLSLAATEDLVGSIGADALCVHLNPAQEMIQIDGDRDFRGGLDTIARLVQDLSVPVVAKETGCGLSPSVVKRLHQVGVGTFDLSGAGGTTWVGVEALRARPGRREIGEDFWDWGLPTGAILLALKGQEGDFIASGGMRNGHDIAKAIALGARAGGMALPFLRALDQGGREAALSFGKQVIDGIRVAMLLTGARTLSALRETPSHCGASLTSWANSLGAQL